ncbi:MAG TPA: dihydroorotase [Acidimicrobiales bacterium]|nr:dihydroorotase [Acidimicrobiales bacterium]
MSVSEVVLLRGGNVIDENGSRRADVLLADGVVGDLGEALEVPGGAMVLEVDGCLVSPGLVDLHAHLREPGDPEAETILTGSRAAALGGYTAVVAMPNTEPAIDNVAVVEQVRHLSRAALCQVEVAAAITVGRAGEHLAPLGELADAGVRLFTDDGSGVQDAGLMRRALEYAAPLGITLAQHCEDARLAAGGHMHEGRWSSELGIPGMPAIAEEAMVARDLALAHLTGARLHLLHLSTAHSVDLVRNAKSLGVNVTCEVTPHHLMLTDEEAASFDPAFKVNPPLRPAADVEALRAALADGTVDAIATDHAPHPPHAKQAPFDQAPPGMLGLETALGVALSVLDMPVDAVLAAFSWKPARIAGLSDHGGRVAPGEPANLCVVDPAATWSVDPNALASPARNTPFAGRKLTGRVRHTIFRGELVVRDGEAQR